MICSIFLIIFYLNCTLASIGCSSKYENFRYIDAYCEDTLRILKIQKHIYYFLKPGENELIVIRKPLCRIDQYGVWYVIPREDFKVKANGDINYDFEIPTTLGQPVDDCGDYESHPLVFPEPTYEKNAGTYMYKSPYEDAYFVYYHLDKLPTANQMNYQVELEDLKSLEKQPKLENEEEIENYAEKFALEYETKLNKIMPNLDDDGFAVKFVCETHLVLDVYCKSYDLAVNCRQYLKVIYLMSREITSKLTPHQTHIIYHIKKAFPELFQWREMQGYEQETGLQYAREKAAIHDFKFIHDEKYFYFPAQWSLLQIYPEMKKYNISYVKKTKLYMTCGEYGTLDITAFALKEEQREIAEDSSYYKDRNFMQISQFLKVDTPNVTLKCSTLTRGHNFTCKHKNKQDVKWVRKKAYPITFSLKSPVSGRIFVVSEDCTLKILKLLKRDEGSYECYARDKRFPTQFERFPLTSYRIKVQIPYYRFPTIRELKLAFLAISYVVLINMILWSLVSYWYNSKREMAFNQAAERSRIQTHKTFEVEVEDLV